MSKINALFASELKTVNLGAENFNTELLSQDVESIHVDWRPPAGGNKALLQALAKLDLPQIAEANAKAIDTLLAASPFLVDYRLAKDVIPGMTPTTILHAGPGTLWTDLEKAGLGDLGGATLLREKPGAK